MGPLKDIIKALMELATPTTPAKGSGVSREPFGEHPEAAGEAQTEDAETREAKRTRTPPE